ncbi:MAG: amidohydrolase family protein [Phycisphaerales bacterium]|nr:amidohydrolase family protein [Phycisphaerales bacterium]
MKERLHLYRCAGICDAGGVDTPQAALLVAAEGHDTRIVALGPEPAVARHPGAAAAMCHDLPDEVIIPALVNAHAHLDLTHLGPLPFEPAGGFVGWVDRIRAGRVTDAAEIEASVAAGVDCSLAGGVIAIGDIAGIGRLEPLATLRRSVMQGVSFLEVFGMGARQEMAIGQLAAACDEAATEGRVRLGLQPHATYSAGLDVFRAALRLRETADVPVCTHLAETPEERAFVGEAGGSIRSLLERLGAWDPSILEQVGRGLHPVHHLADILGYGGLLVAHVNDCPDSALELLAESGTSVAYCPRCSDYFGHASTFGPHRYREMLKAGINVALGTDSVINLPDAARISTLDEMRFLYRRDGTDPAVLLGMATLNGARALGLEASQFELKEGTIAGLAAVHINERRATVRESVVASTGAIRLLHPDPDQA